MAMTKMQRQTFQALVAAAKIGLEYVKATEGTIGFRPNVVTKDREAMEREILRSSAYLEADKETA